MSDENKLADISGGISFDTQSFALGQRIGLKTKSTDTSVIAKAIEALTSIDGDLLSVLDALFGAKDGGSKSPMFGYDPSAKWLAGFAITYGVLTLDVLLVDGQFYGLLIKIDKKKKKKDDKKDGIKSLMDSATTALAEAGKDGDDDNKKDDDGPFAGLQLEIIYRKINDHLGEFSADLTLPKKFSKLTFGEPPQTTTVTLPAVGIAIWTNGDFKVSIGWPLGKRSFNIAFPPNPIPWAGGGGLYFAKLRSEDAPGLGKNFNPIIEFGIGLRIGAATEGKVAVLKYAASLYLFGTFQGFLAWREDHSFNDGLDYYWFCATVGITGHLEGSVDFEIIKVSVSLDITASVTMAIETGHATLAKAEFSATVKASIKILFITIHFSFSLDVSVQITFGSGPEAKISGPTPPSTEAFNAFMTPAALTDDIATEVFIRDAEISLLAAPSPISIGLHFLLQPTIRRDASSNAWLPAGVASLVIDRTAPAKDSANNSLGLGSDNFSLLVKSLAAYLLQTYGNYTNPQSVVTKANTDALLAALDAGQFNLQAVYNWLNASNVTFTFTQATSGKDAALFPMIPGLVLTYNNQSTTFGDAAPPVDYLKILNDYFAKLSLIGDGKIDESRHAAFLAAAEAQPSPQSWFAGVVFADYFGILAKQLYQELADLKVQDTLDKDLAQIDVGNMAGIATRFLQHGLRVPDPSDTNPSLEAKRLRGLYGLTGQQFDIVNDGKGAPVLSAALSGQAKFPVTIPTDGSGTNVLPFALTTPPAQSPLWTPEAMDRIKQAPVSFMLRQGVSWAEQASPSQTNKWLMYGFPDTLQSELRQSASLTLKLSATDGSNPPPGMAGLMIGFTLSLITQSTTSGTSLDSIFQVAGTDDDTRDLMELLFNARSLSDFEVALLLPAGAPNSGAGYRTSTVDNASAMFLKTNLSTYNQPNVSTVFFAAEATAPGPPPLPPLGPAWASITNTTDFLRLLWECSVVHSGGFYLYVPDLKAKDFGAQQQIKVAVMVKLKNTPVTSSVQVANYDNVIMVNATGLTASARVQADVYASDGKTPLTEPKPNYPAGTLAFKAVWNNAPVEAVAANSPDFASTLYQLLQFQLAGGNGIVDSGWSMPLGPDGAGSIWTYKRAVPVYRFVQGAGDTPNRYGAIGIETTINLQLEDVFGNAFGLKPLQLAAVYNDQLISLDEWPGASIVFAFSEATAGNATLTLSLAFQPDQVTQPETALAFYQIIYDQLTDPRVSVAVMTAMAAEAVALKTATGDDPLAAMAKFVASVISYLAAGAKGTAPAGVALTGSVSTGYVTKINEDLFPLWVSLTLSRTAPQESSAYPYPPGFLSMTSQVPPLLNATNSTDPAALRQWAIGFEAAFGNFDGSNGLLKVLVGAPPSKVLATASRLGASVASAVTSTPGDLWALKWGKDSGVAVSFGNAASESVPAQQQPVYFAPLPLSTELITGPVTVDVYDTGTGAKTGSAPTTFSSIDLDGMARSFLQAVDGLLTPDLASAIARLDGDKYNQLMTAKEELAYAISSSISWVFQDQMPPAPGQPGMGDITGAQVRFRESLLASLGSDFATSVIVQMPAKVSVKNQFESGGPASRPPDLFGNPTPAVSTSDKTLNQYTISTATLPVKDGDGYLNFLVEAVTPTIKSDLCLEFKYDMSFLDHRFETSEEKFGYTPSSWLRFIVPETDPKISPSPVLNVGMGQLDIPIPLRAYPSPPRLVRQAAVASKDAPKTIQEALLADYQLTIGRPLVAQDDLHLSIEFNGAQVNLRASADAGGPLFPALANFQNFQAQYLSIATDAINKNTSSAKQWLTDIVSLIKGVADAWQAESEVPTPVGAQPGAFTLDFMLQVKDETNPGVMLLTWTGAGTPDPGVWPTIEQTNGQPTAQANTMKYTLPESANVHEPTLTWPSLFVITHQNVSATAWIVRNENLAGCDASKPTRTTNNEFVYRTGSVTFSSAIIPLLEVPGTLTIQASSVEDAINQLVTQVMQPTSKATQAGWGLQVEYSFVLVSGPAGQIQTKLPVFLARTDVTTGSDSSPTVETVQELINALQGALKSWYADFQPSDTNASLLFTLTLFAANSQQPLARLLDIEAPISGAGWWS